MTKKPMVRTQPRLVVPYTFADNPMGCLGVPVRTSVLANEMFAQPKSLADTLSGQKAAVTEFARVLKRQGTTQVDVVAIGSSMNAANIGKYGLTGVHLNVQEPPDFIQTSPVAIFVSQSGASSDAVPAFEALTSKRRNRPLIVTLTNTLDSPFAAGADIVLPTYALKEEAIAATGTMICATATFFHLGVELAGGKGRKQLMGLPDALDEYINGLPRVVDLGEIVSSLVDGNVGYIAFLGERIFRGVADEAALKVQEIADVITASSGTRMFRHGYNTPLGARVQPVKGLGKALFIFPSGDAGEAKIIAKYKIQAEEAEYLLCQFSYVDSTNQLQMIHDEFCAIPKDVGQFGKAILSVVASQVLAHDLAVAKGLEPGTSEILTKIVVDKPTA